MFLFLLGRLSPRWPGVQDDAVVCAWGQRSVSNRVWQQGLWANAPCSAHTEAVAGKFTSLRLSNVPLCSSPRRLGGRLSHAQLWHTQLLHTQLFYTQLSRTQLVHTHTQLFHNFLTHTHNSCTHNCFILIHHTVLTHIHTQLFHTQLSHTQLVHTHTTISKLPHTHTQFLHTQLFHPHTSHRSNTHTHTYISSTFNCCLTYRSSTTSFVFPSFPVPLQLLFLIIGRSWLAGLSGPLISIFWLVH